MRLRRRADRGGKFLLDYTDVDGRRYQVDTGTTDERLAQAWLAKCQERLSLARLGQIERVGLLTADIVEGRAAEKKRRENRMRMSEFKKVYKERAELEFNLSDNTLDLIEYAFEAFIELIGDKFIPEIATDDILKFKKSLRSSRKALTTEAMYGRTLRTAFNRAVKWGLIESNPFEAVEFPTRLHTRRKDAEMTPEEINKLLDTIREAGDIPFANYVECVSYLGARRNEVLFLRGEDVDLAKRTVTVTVTKRKGAPERVQLPISDALYRVLSKMEIRAGEYLFKTNSNSRGAKKKGKPWHPSHITSTFKEMILKAGLPKHYTIHCLRHSLATNLHSQGVPISVIQKLLTHKSSRLTSDTYDHSTSLDFRRYANMVDFEKFRKKEKDEKEG